MKFPDCPRPEECQKISKDFWSTCRHCKVALPVFVAQYIRWLEKHTKKVTPIPVCYRDKVVGEMQCVSNGRDCTIYHMALDETMLEKLKTSPAALSLRGTAEISEDGEYHMSDVESANFVENENEN